MENVLVSVVILNYNGRNYLEKFLPAVLVSTYEHLKIVIADNGSTDESVDFLRKTFPEVTILELGENFGFARGYNEALRQVKSDYYVLLNSDVEVTPGWIEPVLKLIDQHPEVAICQPKICAYHQKDHFEYAGAAGGWIDFLGYPFARGRIFDHLEADKGQYSDSTGIFWASGAAMFIKSDVYHELGGLYNVFFAHQEEIDLCWRAQNAGFKVACCTESIVYHVGGGTLPKGHRKTYLNFRNNLMMLFRNLPASERVWKIPVRLVLDGVFAVKCLVSGDFVSVKAIWNAHMSFYRWAFRYKRNNNSTYSPMRKLSGVLNRSLVFQSMLLGKKFFQDLFN